MTKATQTTVRGTVTKRSSAQTIRVEIKITKTHPIYKKRYTLRRHFIVHDQNDTAKIGDVVIITPCRPISKLKSWTLVKKVDA